MYGGSGLARRSSGEVLLLPFVLPGERVTPAAELLDASPDRRPAPCPHFGRCGGCQYQMASYPAQLVMKQAILRETLTREGLAMLPAIETHPSPDEWGYRNRIRLRLRLAGDGVEVGYSTRGEAEFLAIRTCPIAAPWLWSAAETWRSLFPELRGDLRSLLERLIDGGAELELFANADGSQQSLSLLVPRAGKPKPVSPKLFKSLGEALQARIPALRSTAILETEPRSGRVLGSLATWGAPGIAYSVEDETYWVSRGGFFQINRFLLPGMSNTVLASCIGAPADRPAWDLFAGVGLFSRLLARHFPQVTAVEASPVAAADLRSALARLGPAHRAVESTTLDFLRRAVLDRERPGLILLDPPRAGVGEEACRLLARLAPERLVYISCDPTTLARDLRVLVGEGYQVESLHLLDLFPQTFHLETLVVLERG